MYRTIFRLIFVLSVLCFSAITNAEQSEKHLYYSGYLSLSGHGNRLYLFKNMSKKPVMLNRHLRYNPGVQAGWGSAIDPGKWVKALGSL